MHELSITEGIMETAIPKALESGAKKILEIRLKIGQMSGVVPACIQEYFSMISKGSIAEDAKIVVETIPISLECKTCGYKGEAKPKFSGCPSCGGRNIRITAGREYYIESLKVE